MGKRKPSGSDMARSHQITINGQKMGKSLGNFITLEEFFEGKHQALTQAYSPMTIRFFILQAHYRSTLDFSNEALQAAEKGLQRLLTAANTLTKLKPADISTVNVDELENGVFTALNDDLNSPIAISVLFDWVRIINSAYDGKEKLNATDLERLTTIFNTVTFDILDLRDDSVAGNDNGKLTSELINMLLNMRLEAKQNKDFATSDKIRIELNNLGVVG